LNWKSDSNAGPGAYIWNNHHLATEGMDCVFYGCKTNTCSTRAGGEKEVENPGRQIGRNPRPDQNEQVYKTATWRGFAAYGNSILAGV
jgi:hypothetical protein